LWPDDLNECLVAASILAVFAEQGAEQALLEKSSEEMDILETLCRELGISYEELMPEAFYLYWYKLNQKGDVGTQEQYEEDDSDWWKKPEGSKQPKNFAVTGRSAA
jgi:hypothetical protein